jgi:hypothetical protein
MPALLVPHNYDLILPDSVVHQQGQQQNGLVMQRVQSDKDGIGWYVTQVPLELMDLLFCNTFLFRKIEFSGRCYILIDLLQE